MFFNRIRGVFNLKKSESILSSLSQRRRNWDLNHSFRDFLGRTLEILNSYGNELKFTRLSNYRFKKRTREGGKRRENSTLKIKTQSYQYIKHVTYWSLTLQQNHAIYLQLYPGLNELIFHRVYYNVY